MNPLHWPRMVAALVSLTLAATVLAAPAASASPPCDGRFAVGGYPQTEIVPDGYQYVPTPGGIWPWEAGGYGHGQQVGAQNLIAAVDEYAAQCDGPIHVFGHSYGAAIVDTATLTLDHRPYAYRLHVHVTGSPRHPGGIESTYQWVPGFRGSVPAPQNVGSYRTECNIGRDIICHAPHPILDMIGNANSILGYLGSGHVYSS